MRAIGRLLAGLCCMASCQLPGLSWAQSPSASKPVELQAIGKILSATGTVTIERTQPVIIQASAPSDAKASTKAGDLVYQGDVIQTGIDGTLSLVFADGTAFNISRNVRMELNQFVYSPSGKIGRAHV